MSDQDKCQASPVELLAKELESAMTRELGPLLAGDVLRRALGYRSIGAFRQAIKRRTVPIPIFRLEKRRGHFALARDTARWLAEQRLAVNLPTTNTMLIPTGGD